MERDFEFGCILDGERAQIERSYDRFVSLPIDQDWSDDEEAPRLERPLTIAEPVEVSAPGTFAKNHIRTLRLEPSERPGKVGGGGLSNSAETE